jgi:hypothetical protein
MDRELPPGLSSVERSALAEFFRGNLTAGQLTQRLGHSEPRTRTLTVTAADAPAVRTASPAHSLLPTTVPRVVRQGLLVVAVASVGVGVGMAVSAQVQPVDAGPHRNAVQITHFRHRIPAVSGSRAVPPSSPSYTSAAAPAAPSVPGPRAQPRSGARSGATTSTPDVSPASRAPAGTRSAPATARKPGTSSSSATTTTPPTSAPPTATGPTTTSVLGGG